MSVLVNLFPDIANDLQSISDLRTTADNKYLLFLKIMAEPLVGSSVWKACFLNEHSDINEVLTSSNEAFLLLCCENYHQKWLTGLSQETTTDIKVQVHIACVHLFLVVHELLELTSVLFVI